MHRLRFGVVWLFSLVVAGFGVGYQQWVGVASAKVDEHVLLERDAEFDRVTAAEGMKGFLSFIADDAAFFPANAPIVTGKEAVGASWAEVLNTPGISLRWQPIRAELAASGELGYTYGHYQLTQTASDGKSVTRHGKYVTIWKKQADGVWRVAVDIGNGSPAPIEP
jgi:ketosteroid isomerase-like protein